MLEHQIKTERLILRQFTESDSESLNKIANQGYVLKWMPDWKSSVDDTRKLIQYFISQYPIAKKEKARIMYAVTLKENDRIIGMVGIGNKIEVDNEIEIAYFISEEYAGNGYITEAANAVSQWTISQLNLDYLIAIVEIDNYPSQKVIERCGFQMVETRMIQNSGESEVKPFYYYRLYQTSNQEMETERLLIRRFKPDDSKDLFEYLSQETVVKYEPYYVFTEEACKQEAIRRSEDDSFWAVCLKSNGKLIGNLYLSKRDFDTWELGYVFNAIYQGKGYATESARKLIDTVIKKNNARRIIAMCNPLNEPSWRLLGRLGFRREGHLIQNIYFKKDKAGYPIWSDTYEYGILASEWLSKNT